MKELQVISYPVQLTAFDLTHPGTESPQKVFACPDPPAEAIAAGVAIAVPAGEFDAGLILEQLPAQFEPDVIFMSARNLDFRPLNLSMFHCPKVMKLGDTNHMGNGTLSEMIEYCQLLDSDYHWIYQGVQHLHFFHEAGLRNVFWLPGSIVLPPFVPTPKPQKQYDVCFRGSLSNTHLYRQTLVESMQANSINLSLAQKSYQDSLEDYAESQIVFNCSGGGDFNRRVFEVLMAGGFLLTDRLRPPSGLPSLFEEGVHLDCYGSPDELLEKVKYYLANPDQADAIAAAGHRKFHQDYHPDQIKAKLHRFIFEGALEAPFRVEHDRRFTLCAPVKTDLERTQFRARMRLYELVQSIHHLNIVLEVLYWKPSDVNAIADLADLPRLNLTCVVEPGTIEAFCDQLTQLELVQQVKVISPHALTRQDQALLIVIEGSDQVACAIGAFDATIPPDSTVLVIGGQQQAADLDQLFPMSRWQPVELLEINSQRSILTGFARAYRKRVERFKRRNPAGSLNLFIQQEVTLKTKIKLKLKQMIKSVRSLF